MASDPAGSDLYRAIKQAPRIRAELRFFFCLFSGVVATSRTAVLSQARDSLLEYCNHLRRLWHKVHSDAEVLASGGRGEGDYF